jgi:hypothetical protein
VTRDGTGAFEKARVTSSGNLLIGSATNSGERLQVTGTAKITGATTINAALTITNGTGASFKINHSASGNAAGWFDTNEFGLLISSASTSVSHYLTNMTSGGTSRFRVNCDGSAIFSSSLSAASLSVSGTSTLSNTLILSGSTTNSYIGQISQTNTTAGVSFGLLVKGGTNSSDIALNVQSAASSNLFRVFGDGQSIFSSSVQAASATITGNLTVDTNTLFVDATDNEVGIGTNAPDARLRVASASANSTQAIFGNVDGRGLLIATSSIAGTNDAGTILNARGATSGTFIFQTDGTQRMSISSTGLVTFSDNAR